MRVRKQIKGKILAKLILHIGPGKCGSSSIQGFLATHENLFLQRVTYKMMDPLEISKLNDQELDSSIKDLFNQQLIKDINGCDILILSHESLAKNIYAIKNICYLSKNLVSNITIIGYARKQSGFLISAYSQWLFRSPERINEVMNTVKTFGIDTLLFTGVENQIIASILNNFYSARQLSGHTIFDWHTLYHEIYELVNEMDVVIRSGVLPNKTSDITLVQDFCLKADLTLSDKSNDGFLKVYNSSFDQNIVEAINNGVMLGFNMPRPHKDNMIISHLSSEIDSVAHDSNEFLLKLKAYIDTYYLDANKQFCKKYNINKSYFEPSEKLTKSEILEVILEENRTRSLNKSIIINKYRTLSAQLVELCIKLSKTN